MMSHELRASDSAARRAAQSEFARPLVLEAGAGTGKTHALVARIVVWLIGPGWERARSASSAEARPEQIAGRAAERVVALTFTEAAAVEMCSRVSVVLGEIAGGELPRGIHGELLPADPERMIRARALLGQSDKLGARTLHAYARHLLSTYPLEAGVVPGFEIDADESQQRAIVREVLEARIGELYGDPADPQALELARRGIAPKQLEEALLALVSARVLPAELERDPWNAGSIDALRCEGRMRLAAVRELCTHRFADLRRSPTTRVAADGLQALEKLLDRPPSLAGQTLESVCALASEVRTLCEPGSARLRKWAKGGFNRSEANALGEAAKELALRMRALVLWIDHVCELDPLLFNAARAVLGPLLSEVERELQLRGVQTYAGLIRDAVALLAQEPVAARVRGQIDQLLVDEFQDTDADQCTLLRRLALESAAGERPGLFLVGDPKQSIYGWRQADLAAYEGFVEEVLSAGGSRHRLSLNFRSVPAILSEVERALSSTLLHEPGIQPAFEPLIPHRSAPAAVANDDTACASEQGASVEYWLPCARDACSGELTALPPGEATSREARALADDLVHWHERSVGWRDMALLLRSRSDLEDYLAALRDRGVPFAVQGDRSYYRRREIIEASAWVRCVLDPRDSVALLTWLRSSPIGVPDAALIPLFVSQLPQALMELRGPDPDRLRRLRELIHDCARAVSQDVPELARLGRAWEVTLGAGIECLAELRASFERDPVDVFVERLRASSLIEASEAARYLGRYRVANLERFFRHLIRDFEASAGDVTSMLRRLRRRVREPEHAEESRVGITDQDAVSVLTIHQAKGLDFRHVYLLQTHKQSGGSRGADTRVSWAFDRCELKLLGAAAPGWLAVEERDRRVERAEQVRTLYVALTRAKDRLVVSGVSPAPRRTGARAPSHAELLLERTGGIPCGDEVVAAGVSTWDWNGARWRVLAAGSARESSATRSAAASSSRSGTSSSSHGARPLEFDLAEARRLRQLRVQARRHASRPLGGVATHPTSVRTAETGATDLVAGLETTRSRKAARIGRPGDPDTLERVGAAAARRASSVGRAVGTIVHRLLEDLELGTVCEERGLPAEALEGLLRVHCAAEELDAVRTAVVALWSSFERGPLHARLQALAPHVVARELPFLCAPALGAATLVLAEHGDDMQAGAIAYLSGVIDLVYRDPDDGTWVIVDYKTDGVRSRTEAEARAGQYLAQAGLYARAVASSLELQAAPRVELWFLAIGEIIPLTLPGRGAGV